MTDLIFDEYAEAYDAWFLDNRTVLESELRLLQRAVGEPGRALSVGCGSGLFESLLRSRFGLSIEHGVEPSEAMARIARKRGLTVSRGGAEQLPHENGSFDTVVFNGSTSYIAELDRALAEAFRVLRVGGGIAVLDVPAESGYGLLYRLGAALGGWEDPRVRSSIPEHPYPLALAASASWRTTPEKNEMLIAAGFVDLVHYQTLTRHPRYSNDSVENPVEGYDRGDYVAIVGHKR